MEASESPPLFMISRFYTHSTNVRVKCIIHVHKSVSVLETIHFQSPTHTWVMRVSRIVSLLTPLPPILHHPPRLLVEAGHLASPTPMASSPRDLPQCIHIQLTIYRMATHVHSLGDLPPSHPSLSAIAVPLHPLFDQLMAELKSYTLMTAQRNHITDTATLSAYTPLVTVLAEQLTRLSATALSNPGVAYVYNSLWMCLYASACILVNIWPTVKLMDDKGDLYATLRCMMVWAVTHVQ